MNRVRRNIIPNPTPVGTVGWDIVEVGGEMDFYDAEGGFICTGAATDQSAQIGIKTESVTCRPGERYGLSATVEVTAIPTVGRIHLCLFWASAPGQPNFDTWFSNALVVGTNDVKEVVTAPAGANGVHLGIVYLIPPGIDPDLGSEIQWQAVRFLLEPLGLPIVPDEEATTNLVWNPSLEIDTYSWVVHTHNSDQIFPGTVWERQNGWASQGDYALRQTIVADEELVPGTNFYGFIGAYIGFIYNVEPGDVLNFQADVNVLDAPEDGFGPFLEIFYYHYDGDPANTTVELHINSDSLYEPFEIGVPKTLQVSATCPPRGTVAQVLAVMASSVPGATLDFYTDAAILAKNQPLVPWFDGDSVGCGWEGLPGRSTSKTLQRSARVQGEFFCGNDLFAQWEGEPNNSMSTINPKLFSTPSDYTETNMELMRRSVAN